MDIGNTRFARLLAAQSFEPADTIVVETTDYVVVPTIGAIVPNWFLIIPKVFAPTFADWRKQVGREPLELIDAVKSTLGAGPNTVWFEHGSVVTGAPIGCGVDHAHIHLILNAPFQFERLAREVSVAPFAWRFPQARVAYENAPVDEPYLLLGDAASGRTLVATDVAAAGSQFFRRAIASIVNRPNEWDYRLHPMLENVRSTLERYHSAA